MTIALRQRPLARVVMGIVTSANGAWLDPSDLSTLYQDAAGTTPVTAVEQPVGLMLDKSRGMMLGPELVTGFAKTGDNGINTVTLYNDGFDINQIDASSVATASITGTFTAGKIYKITADVVVTAGAFKIQNVNWGNAAYIINSNVLLIRCTNSTNLIEVYRNSAGNNAISMRNISVRELYGNHATQSITASRPTLSARYNLLTKTEDFSDAAWGVYAQGTGSTPIKTNNYGIAPDGSQTAGRIQLSLNGGATNSDRSDIYTGVSTVAGNAYSIDVWFKTTDNTTKTIALNFNFTGGGNVIVTGVWQKFTVSLSSAIDTYRFMRFGLRGGYNTSDSADILVWHPQQVVGLSAGPYQRVNTATDYDTDPRYFPKYMRFDGVDDYLNLPYMGLYANGSASVVCAGAFIKTGSEASILSERSTSTTSPAYRLAMKTTLERLSSQVRLDDGMTYLNSTESYVEGLGDGISKVFSIIDSGTKFSPRVNLNLGTEKSYSRTGTLTPNNTTIGATLTTTTTAFIPANLYSIIITKSALTDAQRIKCERYAASKAGVIL